MTRILEGPARFDDLSGVEADATFVDGNRIRYFTVGEREPTLVLLHGGIIDAAHISWGGLVGPLSDHARVVVPDMLGYGESDLPDEPLGLDRHIETMAGFLEELDADSPVLAGISMGGGTALGVGLDYPDRVSDIVALDAYGLGRDLANGLLTWVLAKVQVTNHVSIALMRRSRGLVEASMGGLVADDDSLPSWVVDRVAAEVHRENAGAAFRSFRAQEVTRSGYRTVHTPRLSELSVPVRFVHGANDELFPAAWSERAAELVPESEMYLLEDCGHLATVEQPNRIRELIVEVL